MKHIMLAVSGLSPQVITETLYAIHHNNQHVEAIHIITTREGKETINALLLGGGSGKFFTFLSEYGISPASLKFDNDTIHVVKDELGNEISDIRNETDNERLLKKCLDLAFTFTSDPDTVVFFSVAGGRKTMSACLTLAAQLYGRPQDRLYHVLVSPEFENNREFFYPPRQSSQILLRDRNGEEFYKDTKYAVVTLVNIPFVSIREYLSPDDLAVPKDPGTLMMSLIKDKAPRLTVNLVTKKIIYKKMETDMMPNHLALYTFFILRKKECIKDRETCIHCTECFLSMDDIENHQEEIASLYKKVCGSRPTEEMSNTGINRLDIANFKSLKSKIKDQLMKTYGPGAYAEIGISSKGKRPNMAYGIMMDKSKIEVVY